MGQHEERKNRREEAEGGSFRGRSAKANPALGLVATEANEDQAIRAALNAVNHGLDVIMVYDSSQDIRSIGGVRTLGVAVVEITADTAEEYPLHHFLTVAAKLRGFPGLIYQADTRTHVDFEKSVEASEKTTDFTVTTEPRDDTGQVEGTVLVAVPAYNEASTVGSVVRDVKRHADEVLVVDDGSNDDTATVARDAGAGVIEHVRNKGYGAALKTAFEEARRRRVDHLVTFDADGQHDHADIADLVEVQRDHGAEVVIGSRFADGAENQIPVYRRLGLWLINLLTNLSLGVVRAESRVGDTQSGFRAYNTDAIRTLSVDGGLGDHMSMSTDILYHAHRRDYRIREVGTTIDYGVEDGSNHNPFFHGYVLVKNILNTIERTRPLTSLVLPGLTSVFIGIGFGYWGVLAYTQSSQFPIDRVVAATLFVLVGLFACFSGIVLHSLNKYFVGSQ